MKLMFGQVVIVSLTPFLFFLVGGAGKKHRQLTVD